MQSNNEGELEAFKSYLATHGIENSFSCPKTLEQNGQAEHKMRHIVETSLTLLAKTSSPLKFWLYAFNTIVYLINFLLTNILQFKSPYQILFGKLPNCHHLKVLFVLSLHLPQH